MSKLPFPRSILAQHMAYLGKTGSGKSSAMRVVAEDLLTNKKRTCIVDPKGDWYGLKSSADGKSAGFPVIAFGDFKEPQATDIPINPQSGKHVAELIATGNRPCIIGFRGWMPGQMTKFWIDFASTHRVRRVLLEIGRRLAEAHAIEQPADVFCLTLDELRDLVPAPIHRDHRPQVGERRAEIRHFRAVTPPPVLGTDNGPPPDDPVGRFFGKFFGGPPPASEAPDVLRGNAGSPGKARGPAKVVRSLADATKLQQGDVLVAETTAPPWTPLFATAAAIVTDTGGILSHCAVVAREYRIPAVVGTGRATAAIRDGQILEVDGDAGLVRIDPA